ncbi:S-layer homology domain-containing protein [Brevibacillus sp. SYSU BS000544]|uniref:S-layer homology domain-containing protein n=1 Tax=Brevibacillus sp. SYSU BS000544 TaxID=3416443 RepID=UPI003CE59703
MKNWKFIVFLLTFIVAVTQTSSPVFAVSANDVNQAVTKTVTYNHSQYSAKGLAALDDWALIGLALSGQQLDTAKWGGASSLRTELEKRAKQLDPRKTTDYARFVLTVIAAGFDPNNFAGMNFVQTIKKSQLANGKFADSTNGEGQTLINAHIWSIIALYSAGEQIPKAKLVKSWLVSKQLPDGGFNFMTGGKQSGVDMTAMGLLAYRSLGMTKNEQPVSKAIAFLKRSQGADGGYSEGGVSNVESDANVISALIAYQEDPLQWKKGTKGVVDHLFTFQKSDGSFSHTKAGLSNKIATAQALLGLSDLQRKNSYIHLLRQKAGVKKLASLQDLKQTYWAYKEISYLVQNGYLQGVTSTYMQPDTAVTRAQFAALLLRAIGEEPQAKAQGIFRDVAVTDWTAPIVEKASQLGLIQGSKGYFNPHKPITHEEMAVIVSRVSNKYGWTKTATGATPYVPYNQVSSWAITSVKDLHKRKFLGGTSSRNFYPKATVTRAEASVMLYRLLLAR